jgi:preprotein translocase subunit SecE
MARSKAPPPSRSRPAPARAATAGSVAARAEEHAPKKRTSPAQFFREVRAEGRKITWPSRRETWITTVMVMIMVAVSGVFFLIVDEVLSRGIEFALTIPSLVS